MSYRHLPVTKKVGGKTKRYRNLAVFNRECPKRGITGNLCELTNIRKLKNGEGLATVKTTEGFHKAKPAGTWLLHFADHGIMKRHLKGRVEVTRSGMLDGARRRR